MPYFCGSVYYRKKNLTTPYCLTHYLVTVESREPCCICLETAFIFEEFCMDIFLIVAAAE